MRLVVALRHVGVVLDLGLLLGCLRRGGGIGTALGCGLGRQNRDDVARGERRVAAAHDDLREIILERLLVVAFAVGSVTREDAAQQPTGTVHAHDAGHHGLSLDGDRQHHLVAETAFLDLRALVGIQQFVGHIVPQAKRLGSGERHDLDGAVAQLHGDGFERAGRLRVLRALGADRQAFHERQEHGAERNVTVIVVGVDAFVVVIPRALGEVDVTSLIGVGFGCDVLIGRGVLRLIGRGFDGIRSLDILGFSGVSVLGLRLVGFLSSGILVACLVLLLSETEKSHCHSFAW